MAVRLKVKLKGELGSGATVESLLVDAEVIVLGRDPTCQVVLAQQAVSRSHARISRDGALFFIEDLGSSFGTLVNGRPLPRGEKRLLQRDDVVAIATFDVVFEGEPEPEDPAGGKTGFHAKRAVKKVMRTLAPGADNAYFRVMNGPTEGQRIEFSEGQEYIFGRDEAAADVVLGDDLVSRRHAKVRRDWAGVHLEDLESRNGVKVNRRRIHRSTLKDRDEVEIGGVRFLFIDPSEVRDVPAPPPAAEPDEDEPTVAQAAPALAPPGEDLPPVVVAPEAAEAGPGAGEERVTDGDELPVVEPGESSPMADEVEPRRLDLSNRQTLIALAAGGAMFLVGLVLLILLLAGA